MTRSDLSGAYVGVVSCSRVALRRFGRPTSNSVQGRTSLKRKESLVKEKLLKEVARTGT